MSKRYRLSFFLMFLLVSTPAVLEAGEKGKDLQFSALGEWKLHLAETSETAIPFCTLFRAYEEEASVYVSTNALGSTKTVFGLPPGKYISGKSLETRLRAGEYAQSYTSAEIQDDLLELKIGQPELFFNGLSEARNITLTIEGTDLTFRTENTSANVRDLQHCATGGELQPVRPAPLFSSRDMTRSLSWLDGGQPEDERFNQEGPSSNATRMSVDEKELLESLKKKIIILEREKEALREKLVETRQDQLFELKQEIQATYAEDSYKNKLEVLRQQLEKEKRNNAYLREQLEDVRQETMAAQDDVPAETAQSEEARQKEPPPPSQISPVRQEKRAAIKEIVREPVPETPEPEQKSDEGRTLADRLLAREESEPPGAEKSQPEENTFTESTKSVENTSGSDGPSAEETQPVFSFNESVRMEMEEKAILKNMRRVQ